MGFELRRLNRADMPEAARLFRTVYASSFPWIRPLHTPEEDRAYFEGEVFETSRLWGAFDGEVFTGFIALSPGWIEKLYILPAHHGRGIGRQLVDFAKSGEPDLRLWTFTANTRARRFYEANGFIRIHETDGTGNEEHEPDVLYQWRRP